MNWKPVSTKDPYRGIYKTYLKRKSGGHKVDGLIENQTAVKGQCSEFLGNHDYRELGTFTVLKSEIDELGGKK